MSVARGGDGPGERRGEMSYLRAGAAGIPGGQCPTPVETSDKLHAKVFFSHLQQEL